MQDSAQKVRVVVGDDHPMFRDGVVRALTASGSIDVVAEADDGVAALELIREHEPQVALLDYRMPGLDGAQVAAAVAPRRAAHPGAADLRPRRVGDRLQARCRRVPPASCPRSPAAPNWSTRC